MKNKTIILTSLSSTLLLAGCGQSGPLYLSAPSDAGTTSGIHQQHINTNESKASTKQITMGADTTTKAYATSPASSSENTVTKQQSVATGN